jgi:glycosyltransferase involved in cell wall biosynthesis
MHTKKILFLDQTLNGGGAERVLCTVMRAIDPDKYEIHLVLITKAGVLAHLIPDYVHVHILGVPHTRQALLATIKKLWQIRPDIVYVTTARTALLVALSRYLCPCFQFIMRFPTMPERFIADDSVSNWHFKLMCFFYRRADYVIAQTEEMAAQLTHYFDINEEHIQIINNPVDYKHIDQSLADAQNPFDEEKINIVASGTVYPVKGYDVLIKAFAEVLSHGKDYNLYILGRDQAGNTENLKILCSELEISEYVHFLGFITNPYPYYKFCDLFVLSSRVEGCPNVLLEVLYLGRPVVATICASIISRIVDEGKNGFLVEPDNSDQLRDAILAYKKIVPTKNKKQDNSIVQFIDQL